MNIKNTSSMLEMFLESRFEMTGKNLMNSFDWGYHSCLPQSRAITLCKQLCQTLQSQLPCNSQER